MKYERKTSHSIYDHKYHLCWITKYRFQVLKGEIALKARETIKKICQQHSIEIIAGHIRPEHVHLVASIPPNLSVSKAVQYIKGKSANQLLREFEQLKKRYYGGNLWGRGYYSATSGNITDQMIIEYVKNQDREEEEDDSFLISE